MAAITLSASSYDLSAGAPYRPTVELTLPDGDTFVSAEAALFRPFTGRQSTEMLTSKVPVTAAGANYTFELGATETAKLLNDPDSPLNGVKFDKVSLAFNVITNNRTQMAISDRPLNVSPALFG